MRRLLAAGSLATVVAFGAACGDSDDDGGQAEGPTDNTEQVCTDASAVQADQAQRLNDELTALEQEGLDEEEYEQAALESIEVALVQWSDGLREQAERADDARLTEALSGLADGLADAVPQLTVETVRTGQIPGSEKLDEFGQTLTELCAPAASEPPATP